MDKTQTWINRALLAAALASAAIVYGQCIEANWFYDDVDYVLGDPRVGQLKLFLPWHWSDKPPPLDSPEELERVIPGYEKPLIADRFLWHLSFALERSVFGPDSPRAAHAVNLMLHGLCIALLFLALKRLLLFYDAERSPSDNSAGALPARWGLLPGLAAFFYAIHPWASEPVCYVSARNGSMGAACVLLGLIGWLFMLSKSSSKTVRLLGAIDVLFFTAAAYACKENFGVAPAGYVLATWPVLWDRIATHSRARIAVILAAAAFAFVLAGYVVIRSSDRAEGLFAQVGARGWTYLFEIQNPIVLLTLIDQIPCSRLSLETNHPGWSAGACWAGMFMNIALIAFGTLAGRKRPLLLAIPWFYLFLMPTNSFLPRPDFLAMRNMCLPVMGFTTLVAGTLLWMFTRFPRGLPSGVLLRIVSGTAFVLFSIHWAGTTHWWSEGFLDTPLLWQRCAEQAPDHANVRLNFAYQLIQRGLDEKSAELGDRELRATLVAENSPTMRYHSDRSRMTRRMIALYLLGQEARYFHNLVEAEAYFARSWQEHPRLQTWLLWIETCAEGKLDESFAIAQAEGVRVWPGAWWTRVVRAFQQAQKENGAVSPEVLADFYSAEESPDASLPDLRMLQIRVISTLIAMEKESSKSPERLRRLRSLGASDEALNELDTLLRAK